jgi:hypothetical protein
LAARGHNFDIRFTFHFSFASITYQAGSLSRQIHSRRMMMVSLGAVPRYFLLTSVPPHYRCSASRNGLVRIIFDATLEHQLYPRNGLLRVYYRRIHLPLLFPILASFFSFLLSLPRIGGAIFVIRFISSSLHPSYSVIERGGPLHTGSVLGHSG